MDVEGPLQVSRPFLAGRFGFIVATSTPELRAVVESLFVDYPEPRGIDLPQLVRFTLSEVDGPRWVLGQPIGVTSKTLPAALAVLASEVNLASLGADPSHLHLHAAGAAKGGRAVLLHAPRDTGKTTTVVALAERGWALLSDEMLALDALADVVSAYPKPLSVKPNGVRQLQGLVDALIPSTGDPAVDVLHLTMAGIGAEAVRSAHPHLVVSLRRVEDGPAAPEARMIHPVDAVVQLMGDTLDAERFGPRAVEALSRLAAAAHCYQVRAGTPGRTVDLLEELFAMPGEERKITPLEPSDRTASGVVSVLIDERVVIHDTGSGRVLALDPIGTEVWLHHGGWSDKPPDRRADAPSFIHQLAALGLIPCEEQR